MENLLRNVTNNLRNSRLSYEVPEKQSEQDEDKVLEQETEQQLEQGIASEEEEGFEGGQANDEEEEHAGMFHEASIDNVRASLTLLKTRMKNRPASPAKPKQMAKRKVEKSFPVCTRQSGCSCLACVEQVGHVVALLVQCSSCERSFHPDSLSKHNTNCGKKRKVVRNRVESSKPPRKASSTKSKWRLQSQQLRSAIRSTTHETNEPSICQDELVPCPHCKRRFNSKAAERHIPVCNQIKAKPRMLKRRTGSGAFINSKSQQVEPEEKVIAVARPKSRSRRRVSVSESGVHLSPCPHCNRQFNSKAFERHTDYCKGLKNKAELENKTTSKFGTKRQTICSADRLREKDLNLDELEIYSSTAHSLRMTWDIDNKKLRSEVD